MEDTVKLLGGKIGHIGKVTKGMFKVGDLVELSAVSYTHLDVYKRQGFNIAIGGQDAEGNDFSNEISFLCLKAQEHLGLPQPNQMCIRDSAICGWNTGG